MTALIRTTEAAVPESHRWLALKVPLAGTLLPPLDCLIGLLQGISTAIMAPRSLASIHAIFPTSEKSRALSLYGAAFGLASVSGQLLGGVLLATSPWGGWGRAASSDHLPIIVRSVPAALVLLPESRAEWSDRLDAPGALLLAAGLPALAVPLIEGPKRPKHRMDAADPRS